MTEPGAIPPLDGRLPGDPEPALQWSRRVELEELDSQRQVVSVDQRAAYLASAGMLDLGHGKPRYYRGDDAVDSVRSVKRTPFGLWHVVLPAASSLNLPDMLPMPHPHMRADSMVQTWVTSVSLERLCAPVADGGAGLSIEDLDIDEAWIWPEQSRVLEPWARKLRGARTVAASTGDRPMKELVRSAYAGYIGRMARPELWTSEGMRHHHQPLWRASIVAHCRWRGRRAAMRISRDTGLWPIYSHTDSWKYVTANLDGLADDSDALGKLAIEDVISLSDSDLTALHKDAIGQSVDGFAVARFAGTKED